MRWPFVSREALNIAERRRVDTADALRRAEERFDALLEKYHALASPPPAPAPLTAPTFQSLPPTVAAAIAQATAHAPKDVARAVYLKAGAMLAKGDDEADVAAAVLRGERVDIAD